MVEGSGKQRFCAKLSADRRVSRSVSVLVKFVCHCSSSDGCSCYGILRATFWYLSASLCSSSDRCSISIISFCAWSIDFMISLSCVSRRPGEAPRGERGFGESQLRRFRLRVELAAYRRVVLEREGYTLAGTSVKANTRTSSLLGKLTLRTAFVLSRSKE